MIHVAVLLLALLLAGVALWMGYVSYDTKRVRSAAAAAPPAKPVDHPRELAALNAATAASLAEARATLERTRETLRHGIRGA